MSHPGKYESVHKKNEHDPPTVPPLPGSHEEIFSSDRLGLSRPHSINLDSPRILISPVNISTSDSIISPHLDSNISTPSRVQPKPQRRTRPLSKSYNSGLFSTFSFSRPRTPDSASGTEHHRGIAATGDNISEIEGSATESTRSQQRPKSFRVAKKLTRKLSQAYMKQLNDTGRSRFYDWSRDELIELLVAAPFHYEIRNELHIQTTALRDVADQLYRGVETPLRPVLPTDFELTLYHLMARRIQDAWINHIIWQRDKERVFQDMSFTDQVSLMRQSLDFRDVDLGEEGNLLLNDDLFLLRTARDEVVADEEMGGDDMLSPHELAAIERMFAEQEEEELLRQTSVEEGVEPGSSTALQHIVTNQPRGDDASAPKEPLESETTRKSAAKSQSRSTKKKRSAHGHRRINVFDIPWTAPDVTVAKNYANYVQPRKNRRKGIMYDFFHTTTGRYCCLDGFGEQFDLWEEGQVSEFAQYGSGVTNYFKFMKWLFWLFIILSVVALPMMVLNYQASQGNTGNTGLKALARTTLGNLALGTVNTTLTVTIPGCSTNYLQPDTCTLTGPDLAFLYGILDIVITAVILVAFLWLTFFQQFEEKELNQTLVKPSMYSIAVTHLPKDVTESALIYHFLRLLQTNDRSVIANISLAYNNQEEIDLSFQRGALMREKIRSVHHYRKLNTTRRLSPDYEEGKDDAYLQQEKDKMLAKMKQINQELTEKEKALEALTTREEENQVIIAFITFDKAKDRDYILSLYEKITFWQYCNSNSNLTLSDQWIHVREAPDPSVILWENLMFSRWERSKRRIVTTLSSLLCILLSLVMIFAAKYVQEKAYNNGSSKTTLCPDGFSSWTQDAQQSYVNQYPDTIHCYCDQESTLTQARDSFCQHYLSENISAQVLIYFASFMVLLVNFLMAFLIKRVSKWEKHHTNDGMGISIFLRLFFLKYVNSAAIFLINDNNVILRSIFGLQVTSAPEFTANWYDTVGVTIILVQLGDVINCHADSLWRYYQYSRAKAKATAHPETVLTQDELNQRMIGPKFDLAFNYAELLTTLFVSLTFTTGIPLLYPIAAVNFFLYYCLEKYLFIHMYKIPPHFNTTVGKRATVLIPMALGIHLGMSIWMLSNHKLFADTLTFTDDDSVRSQSSSSLEQYYYASNSLTAHHDFTNYTRKRVLQRATFPLLIALGVVLFVWIGVLGMQHFHLAMDRIYHFWCQCSIPLSPEHPSHSPNPATLSPTRHLRAAARRPRNERKGRGGGGGGDNSSGDIEQGLLWSNSNPKKAEATRYLVTYTRAIQRNLIKGLATYNILQNPLYKEAFGITWKFAVDHQRVRSVRGLKLKALSPTAEDNIEQMETSGRNHHPEAGQPPHPHSSGRSGSHRRRGEEKEKEKTKASSHSGNHPEQKTVEIEHRSPRNRSFYSTLLAAQPNTPNDSAPPAPGSTPMAVTAANVRRNKNKSTKNSSKRQASAKDDEKEDEEEEEEERRGHSLTTPHSSRKKGQHRSKPSSSTKTPTPSSSAAAPAQIELSTSHRSRRDPPPPPPRPDAPPLVFFGEDHSSIAQI